MIGKIKKGKSFGRCIRYVMGKDNAEIIASDGVLLGTNKEMIDSFNCQCLLNPKIKQPLGHIALSFKREDAPRITDEFMTKIALEYMELMGIKNTQFILVRHHNTDNPHCHLVYNRINYDGKVISSQNDFKRNEIAKLYADDKVDVIIYAVEKSLDSYKFNLLHCKQTFISQLKSGAMGARTIDEGGYGRKIVEKQFYLLIFT